MSSYLSRDMARLITDGFEKDPRTGAWFCQKCGSEQIAFEGATHELRCLACGNGSMVRTEEIQREPEVSIWDEARKHETAQSQQEKRQHRPKRRLTTED